MLPATSHAAHAGSQLCTMHSRTGYQGWVANALREERQIPLCMFRALNRMKDAAAQATAKP